MIKIPNRPPDLTVKESAGSKRTIEFWLDEQVERFNNNGDTVLAKIRCIKGDWQWQHQDQDRWDTYTETDFYVNDAINDFLIEDILLSDSNGAQTC